MISLKVAFLTPEFVTEDTRLGGIAAYIYRISRALHEIGHEPEIFVLSNELPRIVKFEGIRVNRVKPHGPVYLRFVFQLIRKSRRYNLKNTYKNISVALGMARALSERENGSRFDFVHSSDFFIPGFFVRKRCERPLIVRSSWARDLCLQANGLSHVFDARCTTFLERMLIRRADIVYAPSKFVAKHYSERYGIQVHTLRPPFLLDAEPSRDLPQDLPSRFLFHFGTCLGPLKGTDILAAALPLVWRKEPSFTLVCAGRERRPGLFREYSRAWGELASRVVWLGESEKPQLYAVLRMAEATVLPSRYDNLPNTAIESLALGVPVVGPCGVSFDELIEPGFSGDLFPVGDHVALAEVMLKVWRREVTWIGPGFRPPAIFKEMVPHVAASNLIRLAGFID